MERDTDKDTEQHIARMKRKKRKRGTEEIEIENKRQTYIQRDG